MRDSNDAQGSGSIGMTELYQTRRLGLASFGLAKPAPLCYNARRSGRGAARLAHLHGVQGVGGSNPLAPTTKPLVNENSRAVWFLLAPIDALWPRQPLCYNLSSPVNITNARARLIRASAAKIPREVPGIK